MPTKIRPIRNQKCAISVEDKGIGISSADLAHIFEPFYRVQSVRDNQIRGVGLGLYLVKRMMEDMGGRVSVTSELGRGTVVVLHFPAGGFGGPDGKKWRIAEGFEIRFQI